MGGDVLLVLGDAVVEEFLSFLGDFVYLRYLGFSWLKVKYIFLAYFFIWLKKVEENWSTSAII